ncbi:hypothetical protein G3T14_23755, partial [Methylobacterium sp. BTF04]|uniref:hypothetical protein n=1 Tax=Methylobacterium sp. BTF04 TaxID=2708300 RepID=UPI0013D7296B
MRNPLKRRVARGENKPTLRERANALKASAARVMKRKASDQNADPFDVTQRAPGFVPYPFDRPTSLLSVRGVIHAEACKLLDMALVEYSRRCDLLGADIGAEERTKRQDALRRDLRLNALAAATDIGLGLSAYASQDGTTLVQGLLQGIQHEGS